MISSLPPAITTDHERPTLKFPAVPPPITPPHLNAPEPLLDINEPTLEEKPIRLADVSGELDADLGEDEDQERDEDQDGDSDGEDEEADRGAKTRIAHVSHLRSQANLRPRKKGQPPSDPAHPISDQQENSDGVPQIEPIDPAAWLADEAHARTSDRRDSADGVDNSDTIIPTPRTRPNVV